MNRKIFIISIIAVGILIIPASTAIDIDRDNNRTIEEDDAEPLDNYEEIITRINGFCDYIKAKRKGIFVYFDVELCANYWGLTIKGIRKPFKFFEEDVYKVNVPCFIGIIHDNMWPYHVRGIAFGNIEWRNEWT